MAASGYGKRSAPDQAPRGRADFAHLPTREAYIAAHIDRLPDGAAVDIKTLAKELPAYGQQAIATALKNLNDAGHLRRIRRVVGEGRTQWVSRWFFSRTARDNAWWDAFLHSMEGPPVPSAATPPQAEEPPEDQPQPECSQAYIALATLGCSDPRLTLSAADCAALEALAAEWFARGITPQAFARILTHDLPDVIQCPGAFTRRRLIDRVPPQLPPATQEPPSPPTQASPPRWMMECTVCGIPGPPEALPDGLCRTCRGVEPTPDQPDPADIHARVTRLRTIARTGGGSAAT
ncbi:MarR family transcriptional regulator [Streptomyces roseoverticillatus]|uniref:MarR family transcriptional regulator n=1 Tax=Streptomyces roseoverticillatus TaxID=66429 RepID=UPI001F3585CC|nr:MarR family transcriptional regulator [Streptomyces roseoverticillatus]